MFHIPAHKNAQHPPAQYAQPLILVKATPEVLARERVFQQALFEASLKHKKPKLEVVKGGRS